jgi:hypothetical protein
MNSNPSQVPLDSSRAKGPTRRRKGELGLQCWAALNAVSLDPDLQIVPEAERDAAIRSTLTYVMRDYRILARWRRPFRV